MAHHGGQDNVRSGASLLRTQTQFHGTWFPGTFNPAFDPAPPFAYNTLFFL